MADKGKSFIDRFAQTLASDMQRKTPMQAIKDDLFPKRRSKKQESFTPAR